LFTGEYVRERKEGTGEGVKPLDQRERSESKKVNEFTVQEYIGE